MPARARRVELHRAAKMLDGFLPPAQLDLQRAEVEPGLRKPSIGGDGFAIVALGLPVRAPGLQNHPEIGERFRVSRIDREQLAAADFGFVEPSGFQVLHGKAVQAIQYHPRMTLLRRLLPLLTLTIAACATLPERTYVNPVIDRDFPDPAVLRAPDGWFYAYATQSESNGRMLNIQVARSRDLVQWALLGDALPGKPRWAAITQDFWAPHVIHDRERDRYVMYYSAEPDTRTGKCLGVATAQDPAGPFLDAGEPLVCGAGIEHIDPMAFDDPKTGKRLLYWGSGRKPIKVQELAPDRMNFLPGSEPRELLAPDARAPYRSLIEGAWLHYRAGTYYLFHSGDRCCLLEPRYAVFVARAASALGPFELLPQPILEKNDAWLAPGHNSIATDDAGSDWMLYHAIRNAPARLMLLDRIEYRDGWPRIAGNQPSSVPQSAPAVGR